ncbi:alpha/beta hydrolase [Rhodococcus koreensis]
MSPHRLIDPELRDLATNLVFDFETGIDAVRKKIAAGSAPADETPEDLMVFEEFAPGVEGAPPVRVIVTAPRGKRTGRPGILHIHGGGYVTGSADKTAFTDATYARRVDAVVVSVDYRLAPETPYPGPLDDCHAALSWLVDSADRLGVDPDRIAVCGQSAGGGLAAALVLRLRDGGGPQVAFQHLVYPMLDDRTGFTTDPPEPMGRWVWTRANNRFGWSALLGDSAGGPHVPCYAAAARATDLSGLPPTFIVCGSLDLFLPEDLDYAYRLMAGGVSVELHVYPGATHGFTSVRGSGVTRRLVGDSAAALRRALGTDTGPGPDADNPAR